MVYSSMMQSIWFDLTNTFALSGTVIGTLAAFDPDGTPGLTFKVDPLPESDSVPLGSVLVDETTGVMTVGRTSAFDYESRRVVLVRVAVTDQGGLTGVGMATITVIDVNERPVMESNPRREVEEHAIEGTLVGAAIGVEDPDAGDYVAFTLSGAAFTIDAVGQVRVRVPELLDFEETPIMSVQVQAIDRYGLQAQQVRWGCLRCGAMRGDAGGCGGMRGDAGRCQQCQTTL